MKLNLLRTDILVRLDEVERDFGDSGLVRPDIAKDKPRWGTVVGTGPGERTKRGFLPVTLDLTDRVLVPFRGGTELTIGGRLHVMIAEAELLAVDEAQA